MYASLPASRARHGFTGGFYVAHHHREPGGLAADLEAARECEPQMLWSFTGTFSNAPVRRRLAELNDPEGRVIDTRYYSDVIRWHLSDTHRAEGSRSVRELRRVARTVRVRALPAWVSDVVDTPLRGDAGRTLPGHHLRRMAAAAVRRLELLLDQGSRSERPELPAILRERQDEAAQLGREARRVWEQFFAPEHQLRTILRAALLTDSSTPRRIRDFGAWLADPQTSLHAGLHVMRRTSQRARRLARSAKSQTGGP